jgi:hypothetical protein
MREPTYLIIVALASMLVALPFSAVAQRGHGGPSRLERAPPLEERTPPEEERAGTQKFGGRDYHGQLAWRDGRWRQAVRDGRDGWWWDVGGFWYFYPQQTEGPPDYVSDIEVADDTTAAPPPPQQPQRAFYYRPGDFTGVLLRHDREVRGSHEPGWRCRGLHVQIADHQKSLLFRL